MDYPEHAFDFQQELKLPFSIDAEQTVIGAIMRNWDAAALAFEQLKPEYFYQEQHKELFTIILRLFTLGTRADAVTILNEAMRQGIFENETEGRAYLVALMEAVPSVSNVDSYCKIVAEKYYMRSLISASQEIISLTTSGGDDAQTLLDLAEQKIYNIRQDKDVRGLTPISDIVISTYDTLNKITGPDKDKYLGAKTGFTMLDMITTGLNRSDLILLAARPGMGKTAFAMNIAANVAKRNKDKKVAIYNLEMTKEQLASRLLSTESLVESNKLRTGKLTADDWDRLASGAEALSGLPIMIDDSAAMTVQKMKAGLRRIKNLGLVIIDYLQLMGSTLKTDNRVQIVSEITRQLKNMAKELDVPIILLSQLNRDVEKRPDRHPQLSDLRDSGTIEQDADIVLFLYREGYYDENAENVNISECIVAKNRHGETSKVKLVWDGQFTRFSNLETAEDNRG